MDNASEDCRFESCQNRNAFFQGIKGTEDKWNKEVLVSMKGGCRYLWDITVKVSRAGDDSGDGHVEDEPLSHDHHLHHHHKEQGQQLVHLQI